MTSDGPRPLYETLSQIGRVDSDPVAVTLSPELIGLLSDQLYRSPLKAIEELVINAYDADASEARVFVGESEGSESFVAIYDDGVGMDYSGLVDLWRVGRPKTRSDTSTRHTDRKQIGKFGIGKLATYTIANRVTYITSTGMQYLGITIDYEDFISKPDSTTTAVRLDVHDIYDVEKLLRDDTFGLSIDHLGVETSTLVDRSWTIVILEDLKAKAQDIKFGRLRWIISTAMPLGSTFQVYLNGDEVQSSKEAYETVVDFDISELPVKRLRALETKTQECWASHAGALSAPSFPSGIAGRVRVTRKTLLGKSADLGRSQGFFVYVRGRLVNEPEARFGLHDLSHEVLNRFHARIDADDLDQAITANRESIEDVKLYRDTQYVLSEVFNEARTRYRTYKDQYDRGNQGRREHERNWVSERLVEHPTADALSQYGPDAIGAEADESWMYLDVDRDMEITNLIRSLYAGGRRERKYTYEYSALGSAARLVAFSPIQGSFVINQDHDLSRAYSSDPSSERLLYDLVTAESMLEVYLREAGMNPHSIGEVLERRDLLFRSLANAKMFSLEGLSAYIRESADNSIELEIAIVAGARALGFVTKHLGGSGDADGIARFTDYPEGEKRIILEAKSSTTTPRTRDIDFAGIARHIEKHSASACLLVSRGYQGGPSGSAAKAAQAQSVSCWTTEDFARVVESAESRQISAREVLDIVHKAFAPDDVKAAVAELLDDVGRSSRELYYEIVRALRQMEGRLPDASRDVAMIGGEISRNKKFRSIELSRVRQAIRELAGASKGGLMLRDNDNLVLQVDYDELERRVEGMTGRAAPARRKSTSDFG